MYFTSRWFIFNFRFKSFIYADNKIEANMTIMSRNHILAKMCNYHTIQNKWTANWIYRNSQKSHHSFTNNNKNNINSNAISKSADSHHFHQKYRQQQYRHNHDHNKRTGKYILQFQNSWKWKFGYGWTILSILDWWLLAAAGLFTWRGIFFKLTPIIGLCLVGVVQWTQFRYENKNDNEINNIDDVVEKKQSRIASNWQKNVYCSIPLRLMSRCFGWLARRDLPESIRPFIYGSFSKMYGVNLNELADTNLRNYKNMCEFFARPLLESARLIDLNNCVVSPADGKILHYGLITNNQIEQVKGVTYELETFLGPVNWIDTSHQYNENNNVIDTIANININNNKYIKKLKINENNALYQCIIYLAPGDYHRFHSATEWIPGIRRHYTGELLSVSPKIANWLPNLFCLNERAVYIGKWEYGFFSYTAVGATNVGSIQINIDEKLKTNQWNGLKIGPEKPNDYDELLLTENNKLNRGDLFGQFNLGSTIILIFEAPINFKFKIKAGDCIKMGEPLGNVDES